MPAGQSTVAREPLVPTCKGFIGSTMDALILFEACLQGRIAHVPRRPHDRERAELIRSGNIFIYEEHSSGIKRWTDGVPWSPSRILGNFLLYRELEKPFQPGEKKRAMKRSKTEGVTKHTYDGGGSSSRFMTSTPFTSSTTPDNETEAERGLVGSLVDSYQFKENGLIKKTISIEHKGVVHHIVSYYCVKDVKNNALPTVGDAHIFANIEPRSSLMASANFRAPIDDRAFAVLPAPDLRYAMQCNMQLAFARGNTLPPQSLSTTSTQPYGPQPQPWTGQQFPPSPGFHLSNTVHPPTTNYGQPMPTHAYSLDPNYGMPPAQPSDYSPMMATARPHSVASGTNQLEYPSGPTAVLGNENGLTTQGLSSNSYTNGDMYGASATESSPDDYGVINTMGQNGNAQSLGSHGGDEFDGAFENGYAETMTRLANGFEGTLQDSTGPSFGGFLCGVFSMVFSVTYGLFVRGSFGAGVRCWDG
ncbi:Gti1/Pac2 family-domain-containing protein [Xylaria palmicola]|nr:Gti1/Pac2 family-domain-containing protein [Xylaria palmicola]